MFPSSVIIAGGKRRCDVNATDPSPCHIQLWPHVRASAVFSEGASGLRALRLVARSAGGSTFCQFPAHPSDCRCPTERLTRFPGFTANRAIGLQGADISSGSDTKPAIYGADRRCQPHKPLIFVQFPHSTPHSLLLSTAFDYNDTQTCTLPHFFPSLPSHSSPTHPCPSIQGPLPNNIPGLEASKDVIGQPLLPLPLSHWLRTSQDYLWS